MVAQVATRGNVAQAGLLARARAALQAGPAWMLLRFVGVVMALCLLACLYVWQVDSVARIRAEARDLQDQATELERENAAMMTQVSDWNRPDYVQAEALSMGMVAAGKPAYVQIPAALAESPAANQNRIDRAASWWQSLLSRLPGQTASPAQVASR